MPVAQLPAVGAALSYDGDWVAGTYQDGQVVIRNGIAYLCVGGPTTVAPDPVPWGLASTQASYGTTLPASPVDGQEAILVDSLTNPSYQWRFRYNAGSSSPYKWEFIGGPPASTYVSANEVYSGSGWANLATVGPNFTIPRAGDYRVEADATTGIPGASGASWIGVADNGDQDPVSSVSFYNGATSGGSWGLHMVEEKAGQAAGNVFRMRYTAIGANQFAGRRLTVLPRRVA